MVYAHPQFDHAALRAQEQLSAIQGRDRLWFCGSYFGYGFHEDALASGLAVAEALGAKRPWSVTDISPAFANATPVP
jgi:predicted NAD/FAD-binding protein